jgi:hypothetical protein
MTEFVACITNQPSEYTTATPTAIVGFAFSICTFMVNCILTDATGRLAVNFFDQAAITTTVVSLVLLKKTRSSMRSKIPLSQIAVAWCLSMNIACCHKQHQARKGIPNHHSGRRELERG